MYPADAVKTRVQLEGSADPISVIRALRKEGGLYRGLFSPLTCDPPKRALKFASNEFFSTVSPAMQT